MQNAPDCIIINDNSENFNCNTEEYKNQLPLGYAKRNLNGAKADTDIIKDNAENFNSNTENTKIVLGLPNTKTVS